MTAILSDLNSNVHCFIISSAHSNCTSFRMFLCLKETNFRCSSSSFQQTFVHCKDKSAIKLLSCSDEESTNDVPLSSASKKSKFKKSVDANNQRRIQQKKQNNVGHTKQSDDVVRSSLSSPKKTDPLQSPTLTSADTHESNLSESEKENNITANMVGAGANVDLFPMLSPRVSILPVMSPHANMPRLLTLNNDNDATRSLSPASSSGTLNENSCDSRSAFIVECKEPIVVTPLEYDDSNFEDDDKDLNHRSLKRPGEQLEEPSKRLAWNSEDIIDKTCLNGALSEMQCETEKKVRILFIENHLILQFKAILFIIKN